MSENQFPKVTEGKIKMAEARKEPRASFEQVSLDQLICFLAVFREGSLAGAANKLNVSKSALCKTIRELEGNLGENLIHGANLTEKGRQVLPHFQQIAATSRRIARILDPNHIHVACTKSIAGDMSEILKRLRRKFSVASSGLQFSISTDRSQDILRQVSEGETEIGIIVRETLEQYPTRGVEPPPETTTVFCRPCVVLMSAEHPLAKKRRLQPYDLKGCKFAWFDSRRYPLLYNDIDRKVTGLCGTSFVVDHGYDDLETLYTRLLVSKEITILPSTYVKFGLPGLKAFSPDWLDIEWPFVLIRARAARETPTAKVFSALEKWLPTL